MERVWNEPPEGVDLIVRTAEGYGPWIARWNSVQGKFLVAQPCEVKDLPASCDWHVMPWQAAKAAPAWVSCAERLPKPYSHVALMNVDRFENCPEDMEGRDQIKAVGYLSDIGGHDFWSVRGERAMTLDSFTHWMELPEPPAEEA